MPFMEKELKAVVEDIKKRFGARETEFRGQVSLISEPEKLVSIAQSLRDDHNFEMLADLTAVDYWPEQTKRFHLVCQFNSYSRKMRLGLRLPLDGNRPTVDSLSGVYPNANWHERELWDMFGIRFEGHPDLRRILMPHDWEGHPLRKDYPLGYEEVQFTFNYDEIDLRKPKPKE